MRVRHALFALATILYPMQGDELETAHRGRGHRHHGHKHRHQHVPSPSVSVEHVTVKEATGGPHKLIALAQRDQSDSKSVRNTTLTTSDAELKSLRLHVAQIKAALDAKTIDSKHTSSAMSDINNDGGDIPSNDDQSDQTPVAEKGIDIDTAMPYGELEPFGREDTAQELTEDSVRESDEMVDQLERAEVAEEKRAVFRALTRLRGAAITSFDGIARSQTGNIDEYNKLHKWRRTHPLHHLADEESDISKWAFPDNADF